ncbi:MAG: DUF3168 domain-containing protein [Pseudomonadota bacterium]
MSLDSVLHEALVAALAGHAPLTAIVTGVFDAPPVRAARPYALIEETVLTDWSTKDMAGREGRITLVSFDEGERPVRLRALASEVEAAMAALPRAIGEGWRVASLVFVRRRTVHEGGRRWAAISEWRVRLLQES